MGNIVLLISCIPIQIRVGYIGGLELKFRFLKTKRNDVLAFCLYRIHIAIVVPELGHILGCQLLQHLGLDFLTLQDYLIFY